MSTATSLKVRSLAVVAAIGLIFAGLFAVQPAFADSAPPNPANPATPATVTDDVLPTPQINGVVWDQVVVGNIDYVVGDFTQARPFGAAAGVNAVTRNNILAYNVTTGALITTFAPSLNAEAITVAASPDGSRIYVGGNFTTVDGVGYYRIAAFSTATGAIIPSFKPIFGSEVRAITATNTSVYAGGWFKTINGASRLYVGAVAASNGATLPFTANADYNVNALALTTDGTRLIVGGQFANLSGKAAKGLGAVDPTSGAYISWAANQLIQDYGTNSSITSLFATPTAVYGSGYKWTGGTGNLEGVFQANPTTGTITGMEDCHGDTYEVYATNSVMYEVGHQHFCGNVGGFPQTEPTWTFHHLNAFSTVSTSKVKTNTESGYYNFAGQPALTPLDYYPDFTNGTFTGQNQATWSVAGNSQYIVAGGEFPSVNGIAQQGLTRFAIASIAPNKVGPQGVPLVPVAKSTVSGQVAVSWNATYDSDNGYLTYNVYRDGGTTSIYSIVQHSNFFTTPAMGFTDTGLTPGSSHTYKVVVTDPFGNSTNRSTTAVKVSGTVPANKPPVASFTTSTSGLTVSVNGSASTDPDGTIASYSWNFGDGATATGATATHTYATGNTYTITLTVKDNGGATNAKSSSVTVTGGVVANKPPVASFTSSTSGLTVSVNGTGSTDPDGAVASYAWTFGDGGTATGSTASHTYVSAGTYTVTLTVTDNQGATNAKSTSVTVAATQTGTAFAKDAFGRTTASGWGTADVGGAWTVSGSAANYKVASSLGQQSGGAGATLTSSLAAVKSTSTDAVVTTSTSIMPTGGGVYISDIGRLVGSTDYEARVWIKSTGAAQLQLLQTGTVLATYTVPSYTYTAGAQLNIRVQVFGTSPTTIRARTWAAGTAEPTTWQASVTDSTAALQAAGGVGLRSYVSGSATAVPVVTRYSNFVAVPAS